MTIVFIDITISLTHKSIINRAIGASEYQFYSLIKELSKNEKVKCFNLSDHFEVIDNVEYDNVNNIANIDPLDKIIIQRFFPHAKTIRDKIINNQIFLWLHDIPSSSLFLFKNNELVKYYEDKQEEYVRDILLPVLNFNLKFVCNSNNCKQLVCDYLLKYNIIIEDERLPVIYNILYEDEFKNSDTLPIDINAIVYASAWQKGIDKVVNVFNFMSLRNKNLKLILMSPGYDNDYCKEYRKKIEQNSYLKNKIIILGPQNKKDLIKIIKSSLCLLSSTFNETFGCIFAESYYVGTPVIADIRSGAVKEIIDNEYVVNYDNPQSVFDKIIKLQSLRHSSNIHLDKKFMLEHNIELWKKLLSISCNNY